MKLTPITSAAVVAVATAILSSNTFAGLTYNADDLFLSFRLNGSATDLVIDIGPAATYRDATVPFTLTLTNLTSQGTTLFGSATWKTDSTGTTWGVIGTPGAGAVGSDGANLLYVSEPGLNANPANTLKPNTNFSQSGPVTQILSMKNYYAAAGTPAGTVNGSASTTPSITASSAKGDTTNSVSWTQEVQNTFNSGDLRVIEGATNNSFGLDLFRVPNGTSSTVTNEGRFTLGSGDQVLFTPVIVPEPSTLILGGIALLGFGLKRHRRIVPTIPA